MKKKLIAVLATMVVSVTAFSVTASAGGLNVDNVAKNLGSKVKVEALQAKANDGQATISNGNYCNATATDSSQDNNSGDQQSLNNSNCNIANANVKAESNVKPQLDQVVDSLQKQLSQFINNMGPEFGQAVDNIKSQLGGVTSCVKPESNQAVDNMKSQLTKIMNNLKAQSNQTVNNTEPQVNQVVNNTGCPVSQAVNNTEPQVNQVVNDQAVNSTEPQANQALNDVKPQSNPAPVAKTPETTTNNSQQVTSQPAVDNNSSVKYMADFEADILKYTNIERQKAGLQPLKLNNTFVGFARSKSEEMIRLNYFDHSSPENGYISDIAKKNNIAYSYIGENIYTMSYSGDITTVSDGQKIVDAWMNSPGHRANILNPNYTEIGIGVAYANGTLMASQEFYTP